MAKPKRRKKVIVFIDTPPGRYYAGRYNATKPFEVYINNEDHGRFKAEQEARDYVHEYLRDEMKQLVRMYIA